MGHSLEYTFVHSFDLSPGRHRVEVRLGASWGSPLSRATTAQAEFTVLDWQDGCPSASSNVVVVDAFPFFNELDILEARLHEVLTF